MVVKVKTAAELAEPKGTEVKDELEVEVEQTGDEDEVVLPEGDTDEWGDLLDEIEEDDLAEPIKDDEPEPKPKDEPIPEGDTPAVKPAEEPIATPEEVIPEVIPEVTEEVQAPKKTPEEVQAELATARTKAEEELVSTFQLTEEQADALVEEPNKVLPQMMAKLYLDSYTSVMQAVQQQMPQMVQAVIAQSQAAQDTENSFFQAWPQLSKPEYKDTLDRIADTYRAVNPKANAETMIKEVGAQAWVALQLPIDELMAHTAAVQKPPAAPAKPTGRLPAGPGNPTISSKQVTQKPKNEFEQLADEFLLDDD